MGGGIIRQNSTRHGLLVALSRVLDTHVIFASPGATEYDSSRDPANMMGAILNHADLVSVRDRISRKNLELTGTNNIELIPDPVFYYEHEPHPVDVMSDDIVVFVPGFNPRRETDIDGIVQGLRLFLSDYSEVTLLILPFHDSRRSLFEIRDALGENSAVLADETNFDQAFDIIASADLVVGMKLHSIIMSHVLDTPAVGVSYHKKSDIHLKMLNKEYVRCDNINPYTLFGMMKRKYENRGDFGTNRPHSNMSTDKNIIQVMSSNCNSSCSKLRLPVLILKVFVTMIVNYNRKKNN